MRNSIVVLVSILLVACSSSDGNGGNGAAAPNSCSNDDQKRFVRDAMQDWYLWNNLLPNNISVGNYASPEALLADLMTYSPDDGSGQPIDHFSFIGSAAADAAFFGEGKYEGFGFSSEQFAADDIRLTQVFANSPADLGGLARGQRIIELGGRTVAAIQAAEGINAVLATSPLTFLMREPGGTQFTTTITRGIVTITPVPQYRVIAAGDGSGRMVGYVELASFISTANSELSAVFADFIANGVNDVILDLRYNGGGLVSTANLLGDLLGGDVAENLVFSETHFNADRAAANNSIDFFGRLAASMSLSRLVVVASDSTASASELVINSMAPHVEVTIVGGSTFGKPVGQVGFEFCDKILRLTAFQTVNADGFGDYFDGIPVNCPAVDDLSVAVGLDADPNIVVAMAYLDTGACSVTVVPTTVLKAQAAQQVELRERRAQPALPPWQEFAGAY
ncbi:MAG: S41 family peptidase [Proteobacteria bacterium]|nr:S41 family peptidase [Pseudomonadota bacterium]